MNKLKTIIVLASLIILCACHHKNPLKSHSKQETISFLMNASANAEQRHHFSIQKDSYGYAYLECMDGKNSPEIKCNVLYEGIVSFAKEGYYQGFEQLTVQDLADYSFFLSLADEYAEFAATHEPHFVTKRLS
jgi:hypothetical protein